MNLQRSTNPTDKYYEDCSFSLSRYLTECEMGAEDERFIDEMVCSQTVCIN